MEESIERGARGISRILLILFALVGAAASLTTVVSFFSSPKASNLRVDVYSSVFHLPPDLTDALNLNNKPDLRRVLGRLEALCSDSSAAEEPDKELCAGAAQIQHIAERVTYFYRIPTSMYFYNIKNDGLAVAKGIRLTNNGIALVAMQTSRLRLTIVQPDQNGHYNIRDLNPGESVTLYVWSTESFAPGYYNNPPPITSAEGRVFLNEYSYIPKTVKEFYDYWIDIPPVFLVIQLIVASFVICFIVIFALLLVQAIWLGRPLRSLFTAAPVVTAPPH